MELAISLKKVSVATICFVKLKKLINFLLRLKKKIHSFYATVDNYFTNLLV